jgi:colanic acid/amylovoran biosynthesis glycosyltransferase
MRIAYFVEIFPQDTETFILRQICASVEAGHDVYVFPVASSTSRSVQPAVDEYALRERTFAPNARSSLPQAVSRPAGVREHLAAWRSLFTTMRTYGRLGIRQVADHLRTFSPASFDVIHAHFGPSARRAALLIEMGWIEGPLIATFHGFDVNVLMRRYPSSIYQPVFDHAAEITVGSTFMHRLMSWMGAPADRLAVRPMGVPLDDFPYRPVRANGPHNETVFITVGSVSEHKGQTVAIEALAKLPSETHPWHYHIVGGGPLETTLRNRIAELDIGSRITIHGWTSTDEVQKLLSESDILLHPARQSDSGSVESQGVALAEAHAVGLPIIASDCGGISDTVIDAKTGYLVPPDDADALHKCIESILGEEERWSDMGRAGRAHVEANYSHEKLMEEQLGSYEQVAKQYSN